jgi:hypothetical protein
MLNIRGHGSWVEAPVRSTDRSVLKRHVLPILAKISAPDAQTILLHKMQPFIRR